MGIITTDKQGVIVKEFARKQIEEIYEIGMDIRKAESRKPGYSDGIKKILTGLYPDDVHFK